MYSYNSRKFLKSYKKEIMARNCTWLAFYYIKIKESSDNDLDKQGIYINVEF